MSIKGFLESYSLPELFRLLDSGCKSGKLIVEITPDSSSLPKQTYYIWFYKGRLVAITKPHEEQRTLTNIRSKGWLSDRVIEKLLPLCPDGRPLGTYFKSIGALSEKQLNEMFEVDLKQVLNLFEVDSGRFEFENFSDLEQTKVLKKMPCSEMTGISLRGTEVALSALRRTKNWDKFNHQLPDNSSGLQRLTPKSQYRLVSLEQQLWQYSDSVTAIREIAKRVKNSDLEVKRAAFRLMMAGLVEEVPQANLRVNVVNISSFATKTTAGTTATATTTAKKVVNGNGHKPSSSQHPTTNPSLIKSFMAFLRQKL